MATGQLKRWTPSECDYLAEAGVLGQNAQIQRGVAKIVRRSSRLLREIRRRSRRLSFRE